MSIIDVARRAGVSVSTVSRVINHQSGVAPETEERIRSVMEELGYVPPTPEHRRGPKSRSQGGLSGAVLMLLLSREANLGMEGGFLLTRLEAGLHEGAAEHGALICVGTVTADGEFLVPRLCTVPKALLILDPGVDETTLRIFGDVPRVYLMTPGFDAEAQWDAVMPDNMAVGRLAARHLLQHGHRRLAVINPFCCWASAALRSAAFVGVARAAGALVDVWDNAHSSEAWADTTVPVIERRPAATEALTRAWLASEPRATGLFVVNDAIAAVVYGVLTGAGVTVGVDVEVVSCNNDQAVLATMVPRPVTYDLRPYEIGRQAIALLAARCAGRLITPSVCVHVPPHQVLPKT